LSDKNTRVIVFVRNLPLPAGAPASIVVVNLVDANSQSFDVPAQDVRIVPSTEFVQVIFRLPDNLAIGTCTVKVKTDTQITGAGTMRIRL
jgi:hypothetical protein